MAKVHLNINGYEIYTEQGNTILQAAREHGIEIPTLCYDERVKTYGACGVCLVEVEGNRKLLRACATKVAEGMVVRTDTRRVVDARKIALELLISDHDGDCRAPCSLNCPAGTDCQGYVGMIANGEYKEAIRLIKERIPLPSSIGRVCPHPCEKACRRQMVEEPISIAWLKSFAGDMDRASKDPYMPPCAPNTGKHVAVIGGGPGGLTAANFLRRKGHAVTVYDAMPHMGGMLRYGIPQYRLPKEIVDEEVASIAALGVEMKNNIRIGTDITLDQLRAQNDAVVVAIGAWTSMNMRVKGEELKGVVGGIDFLRDVILGNKPEIGKKVAICGGGNTAMDACRTAVRLGAEEVYVIYRRTRAEMPADDVEITEAEEEGVTFKFLTNPDEILGKDGKVTGVRLQIMELGEPDESGRRRPVPVEGKFEEIELDTVIMAIGQGTNPAGFEQLELTRKHTISADEKTYRTSMEGVFAVGDATNRGASIAIEAIGEGQKAADVIDSYLNGETVGYEKPFVVERVVTAEDFKDHEKAARVPMPHLAPEERKHNFEEVVKGFTPEMAKREASRCLECGCHDYYECKLIHLANEYHVEPQRLEGEKHHRNHPDHNEFIIRNPDKCILCGLCVRVCDEVMGNTALGLVGRGFDTLAAPEFNLPLDQTDCVACGQCVALCPTGALMEIKPSSKSVPAQEKVTRTTCSFCSVGCQIDMASVGNSLWRALPADNGLLCKGGRFGFGALQYGDRVTAPTVSGAETTLPQAYQALADQLKAYDPSQIAFTLSDRLTMEEAYLASEFARKVVGTDKVITYSKAHSAFAEILGADASTNTFDELLGTDAILLIGSDLMNGSYIGLMKIKQAVEKGAKLVVIGSSDTRADDWASLKVECADTAFLTDVAAVLKGETVDNDQAQQVAALYRDAKNAMVVCRESMLTREAACAVGDILANGGHIGRAYNGIILFKDGANAQGLDILGVKPAAETDLSGVKALVNFGEELPEDASFEFTAVFDCMRGVSAQQADILIPLSAATECGGTFIGADRMLREVRPSVQPACGEESWNVILAAANACSADSFRYDSLHAVTMAMCHAIGVQNTGCMACGKHPVYWSNSGSPVLTPEVHVPHYKLGTLNSTPYVSNTVKRVFAANGARKK